MGCISGIAKVILVLLNLAFMIVGLVMVLIGALIKFVPTNPIVANYENDAKEALKSILSGAGMTTDSLNNFSISDASGTLSIALMAIGGVLLIFNFCGFFGSICQLRKVLLVYAIIIGILCLAQIILVIIIIADASIIKNNLRDPLKTNIKEEYQGLSGSDVSSIAWNIIMIKFKCCGAVDYLDFDDAKKWSTNQTTSKQAQPYILKMPVTCCNPFPTDGNLSCAETVPSGNSKTGCFELIWNSLFGDDIKLILGALAFIGFQILLGLCAIVIFLQTAVNNAVADKKTAEKQKDAEIMKKMDRFIGIVSHPSAADDEK